MAQLHFLSANTHSQMLGFVVQTASKTIVFDGGTQGDGAALAAFLRTHADSCVDAWFFTHPHHDHFGAFLDICQNAPDIRIERLCCHFPTTEQLIQYGSRAAWEIDLWERFDALCTTRFATDFQRVNLHDAFTFDDLTVRVMRVFDPNITKNFVNNSSTVYRIDTPQTRVLILGDLGKEGGDALLASCDAAELYADYVQMAHHGQSGVDENFYRTIKPAACLWSTPDWLWDNDNGGGVGSGPWKTLETRAWMQALGVTKHILNKDGTVCIDI